MKKEKITLNDLGITAEQHAKMCERIKERRDEMRLKQHQLAKLCGFANQSRISHYESGIRIPSLAAIKLMAKHLKTTVDYLLHGIAPLYNFKRSSSIVGVRFVPIISITEAKNWENKMQDYTGNIERPHIAVPSNIRDTSFCLIIEDDTMTATTPYNNITFFPGDQLIFDSSLKPKVNDFILVELPGVEKPVFRKYIEEAGTFYLSALNTTYKLRELPPKSKILGVLVYKCQKFRDF